jgi:hypothetical protein
MMRARNLGAAACSVVFLATAGVLGALGCGTAEGEGAKAASAETLGNASVAITLHDANGTRIGEGSGTLIAPRLVLTAAHLVAGKSSWLVKTADGKTVRATRGVTYDWLDYKSSTKSHPRRYDVAVLYLDEAITLSSYPSVAGSKLPSGSVATRTSGAGLAQKSVLSTLETIPTFPRAYVTSMSGGESLDTGGAVVSDRGEIVAIVMGRGLTTGKLYVSRTDTLKQWLAPKLICGGATTTTTTYGVPPGSSGGTSGGTSGTSGGSSGTSGTNGSPDNPDNPNGGTGGGTNNCNDGGGNCYGSSCPPSGGTDGSTSPTPTPPSGDGSGAGSPPGSGAPPTPGTGSGGGGTGPGGGEACSSEDDNPELCPPENDGCTGATCGGGFPDPDTDFGMCSPTCGNPGSGSDVH